MYSNHTTAATLQCLIAYTHVMCSLLTIGRGGLPRPCGLTEGLMRGAVLPDVEGAEVLGVEFACLPLPDPWTAVTTQAFPLMFVLQHVAHLNHRLQHMSVCAYYLCMTRPGLMWRIV